MAVSAITTLLTPFLIKSADRVVNWFDRTAAVVPNHMIEVLDASNAATYGIDDEALFGRSMVVRRAEPLPVECVVRGYLAGSAWADYRAGRFEDAAQALEAALHFVEQGPRPRGGLEPAALTFKQRVTEQLLQPREVARARHVRRRQAGGVGEALIATAAGLVIAIIGLIPYNILNSRIETAKKEGVHCIGLSILSGSHVTLAHEVMRLMKAEGVTAPLVVGGVTLDTRDAELNDGDADTLRGEVTKFLQAMASTEERQAA